MQVHEQLNRCESKTYYAASLAVALGKLPDVTLELASREENPSIKAIFDVLQVDTIRQAYCKDTNNTEDDIKLIMSRAEPYAFGTLPVVSDEEAKDFEKQLNYITIIV